MRRLVPALAALAALALSAHGAQAGVLVRIDKFSQRMIVSVDGRLAYVWPVSTGRGGYGTPNGRYRPRWLARHWFSTRYYGSPMPHSIFFHRGYAIHGTNYISRLGGPASHGCVRLHPGAAATLFALVQRAGMANTAIVITGGNPGILVRGRARSAQAEY
jgi:lipoprotein-anchoring transpeptidase ErfK/SrfK